MRVLVLGATGHIGNAVVRECLDQGYAVTAVSRRAEPAQNLINLPVHYLSGDIETPGRLDTWVKGHDVVVDAAAPYPLSVFPAKADPLLRAAQRTDALLAAVRRHHARLVYISSMTSLARPRVSVAVWQVQLQRLLHPYFALKQLIDARVLTAAQQGLPAVTLHLPTCLGPWDLKARDLCFIPRLLCGEIPVALEHLINVIDVRDVATGVLAALQAERYGEPIALTGHALPCPALFAWICELGGARPPGLSLPPPLDLLASYSAELLYAGLGKHPPFRALAVLLVYEQNWLVLSTAQHDLGVVPRPLSHTLSDSIQWYRSLGYC